MTPTEQNKTVVQDFIQELFTKGNLGAVDRYLAEDFIDHNPPFGGPSDREGMRSAGGMFRAACPDWHSDLLQLIAEDDLVAEVFVASGTQTGGDVLGVAADGRSLTLHGINVFRLRDGKIVERWGRLDDLGLVQQLGIVDAV